MKTTKSPDDVKKGLECLIREEELDDTCGGCDYLFTHGPCAEHILPDALALIQQLQTDNAQKDQRIQQLEAERDAAVKAIFNIVPSCYLCDYCKNSHPIDICPYVEQCQDYAKWEWRGVTKEE